MQYIPLSKDKFIEYNETNDTSRVLIVSELEEQIAQAQERLSVIPQSPSDEELLAWARLNYPMMDYSTEKQKLESIVADNTAVLTNLK